MTPYQKAKEIFDKMHNDPRVTKYDAKICAVTAINEVIIALDKNRGYTQCVIDIKHWEEVRDELNAL